MTNVQRKNRLMSGVFVVLLLCGTFYTLRTIRDAWFYNPQARIEMKHLFGRLQLGQSKWQVQDVFNAGNYQKLKRGRMKNQNNWAFKTPLELEAGNWILYIDFDKKDKVAALKLRTADNIHERPREPAPADKIAP